MVARRLSDFWQVRCGEAGPDRTNGGGTAQQTEFPDSTQAELEASAAAKVSRATRLAVIADVGNALKRVGVQLRNRHGWPT
jgi:hypothetical protein